jgi:hypothetical protein
VFEVFVVPGRCVGTHMPTLRGLFQIRRLKVERISDALEWLTDIFFHLPNKGDQMLG